MLSILIELIVSGILIVPNWLSILLETTWLLIINFFSTPGVPTLTTLTSAIWAVWYMSKQIRNDRRNTQEAIKAAREDNRTSIKAAENLYLKEQKDNTIQRNAEIQHIRIKEQLESVKKDYLMLKQTIHKVTKQVQNGSNITSEFISNTYFTLDTLYESISLSAFVLEDDDLNKLLSKELQPVYKDKFFFFLQNCKKNNVNCKEYYDNMDIDKNINELHSSFEEWYKNKLSTECV